MKWSGMDTAIHRCIVLAKAMAAKDCTHCPPGRGENRTRTAPHGAKKGKSKK